MVTYTQHTVLLNPAQVQALAQWLTVPEGKLAIGRLAGEVNEDGSVFISTVPEPPATPKPHIRQKEMGDS